MRNCPRRTSEGGTRGNKDGPALPPVFLWVHSLFVCVLGVFVYPGFTCSGAVRCVRYVSATLRRAYFVDDASAVAGSHSPLRQQQQQQPPRRRAGQQRRALCGGSH